MEKSFLTEIEQYVVDFVLKLRIEKELDQADIASILDVKQPFIAGIESRKSRAKYNLNHIDKLADHFGLSPKDFLPEKSFTKL
ncbi:MAG: helix-turn-helix transcriptional regulator [Candidatus Dojkabacteria bacterium]